MFLFEPMASDMFNNTNPFLGSPSSTTGMSGNLFPPSPSYDGDIDMMNTLLAFDPSLDSCQPSTSSASVSVTAPMSMPVPQQQQHQQHQLQQQQPQFDYSQYVYPTTTQQAMMPMDAISASMTMPFAMPTTTSMPMQQATSMPMQFTPSMSPPFATYPYNATYPLLLQQPPTSPPNTGKAMLIPLPAEYPQPAVSMSVLDADGLSPTQRAKKEMAHKNHVIGGLKATLNNPHTSTLAKQRAARKLEIAMAELEACKRPIIPEPIPKAREETDEEHRNRMIGGYRACLANPNAGGVAKQNARRMIDALTTLSGPDLRQFFDIRTAKAFTEQETADMRLNRIIGGHKAVIANSGTSEIAKEHSRSVLRQYGIEGY